jgi:uncharacterized membrane protein
MSAQNLTTVFAVALVGALICVIPALTAPTLQFGVRVPPDRLRAPVLLAERRRYFWRTGVIGVCLTAAALSVPAGSRWLTVLLVVSQLAAGLGCYFVARERVLAVKTAQDWFGGLTQTVGADTTWRTEPERFPVLWLVPALAIIVVTAAVGIARYPGLPQRLPVHFSAGGVVDRYADKSVWAAFTLVAVQIFVTAMMTGLLVLTYRSRPEVDAADVAGSTRRYGRFLFAMSRAVLATAALVDLSLLLVSLQIWQVYRLMDATVALAALPPALGVFVLVVVSVRMGQAGTRLAGPAPAGETSSKVTNQDDDRYWKGGLIYVNRDDPAIMVARRFGVGWTLNFGNPRAWVAFAVVIVAVVALVVARRR